MTDDGATRDAVVIERSLDAPVDVIWLMWTDPEHFKKWYGPDGATIPVATMDVRVGGSRLLGMELRTPNGVMHRWFAGEYLEVVENERLVYTESMSMSGESEPSRSGEGLPDGHAGVTEVLVELEDLGGRTRMVMTHAGVPGDSPGAVGWTMALDKLVAHVAARATP